ncbi:hypothetical protein [Streptomyces sp. NPDC052701]|uniref:hypothetical protein n=1 Tax=Streptomyces sp. NPDC052701 TaxID=3155533 RepID=UPI0034205188
MSEHQGPEWTDMTPADFDREAPLRLDVDAGAAPVPAEPDEYGTPPLFGRQAPPRPATRRRSRNGAARSEQGRLF